VTGNYKGNVDSAGRRIVSRAIDFADVFGNSCAVTVSNKDYPGERACKSRRCRRPGGRSAAALMLILLLVGVVTVLVLHAQMTAAMTMRYMQTKQLRTSLVLAASDAAWLFLSESAKKSAQSPGTTNALPDPAKIILPSGVVTDVVATDQTEAFLATIPGLGNEAIVGRLYMVQSSAAASGTVEQVSCIYRKPKNGGIEVMGWYQTR